MPFLTSSVFRLGVGSVIHTAQKNHRASPRLLGSTNITTKLKLLSDLKHWGISRRQFLDFSYSVESWSMDRPLYSLHEPAKSRYCKFTGSCLKFTLAVAFGFIGMTWVHSITCKSKYLWKQGLHIENKCVNLLEHLYCIGAPSTPGADNLLEAGCGRHPPTPASLSAAR